MTSNTRGNGNGRGGGGGTNLPLASASTPKRAEKVASVKRTGDAGQNSRRNAPRPTPRQEYTLFDHLLANNRPPPRSNTGNVYTPVPRQGDKIGVASRPRLSQRDVLELGGTTEGGNVFVRPDLGSSPSAPFWPSSAEHTKGAAEGTVTAAATTGKADTRYLQYIVAASASSSRGGAMGRGKGHTKPGTTANSFNPKPGKQRLGPRLKKFSTLKKRILLDRAAWWKEHGNNPTAETRPPSPPSPPPSGVPPACAGAARCRNDDDDAGCARGSSHGGDIGNDEPCTNRDNWTVVIIHHLVDEEDVEESDEHAEVVRDLSEMAETFGVVKEVDVPRSRAAALKMTGGGGGRGEAGIAATVTFETREEAEHARRGFHGRVVGGKTLEVEIAERAAAAGERDPCSFAAREEEACDATGASVPPPEEASLEEQPPGGQNASVLEGAVSVTEMRGPLDGEGDRRFGYNAVVVKKELGEQLSPRQNTFNRTGDEIVVKKKLREEPIVLHQASEGGEDKIGEPPRPRPLWRVVVSNLVNEEDDLDDEDDYAEICADAARMMETHGPLVALDIPRVNVPHGEGEGGGIVRGQVVATFSSLKEAEACVAGTRGRRVGGQALDARLLEPQALAGRGGGLRENGKLRESGRTASPRPQEKQQEHDGSRKTVTGFAKPSVVDLTDAGAISTAAAMSADQLAEGGQGPGGGGSTTLGANPGHDLAAAARWSQVVVKNLIEEEDLEDGDDDDCAEVRADLTAMASVYGDVVALFIPQQTVTAGVVAGAERGEAIVAFGSPEEAEACAQGLDGKVIGGKCLETKIVLPPSQPDQGLDMGDRPVTVDKPTDGRRPEKEEELSQSRLVRNLNCDTRVVVPAGGDDILDQGPGMDDDHGGGVHGRGGQREGHGAPTSGAMAAGSRDKPTAAAQSSLFVTSTSAGGKMRIPDKYKEAAALPKPPGVNDRTPRVYVNQARF